MVKVLAHERIYEFPQAKRFGIDERGYLLVYEKGDAVPKDAGAVFSVWQGAWSEEEPTS